LVVSSPVDPGTLRSREWDFLHQLAERMEAELDEDPTADLSHLLPPSSAPRDRLIALHEMIKIELGFRWSCKRPILLEEYLQRFPELGSSTTIPVALIFEEYRARHLWGDHPTLDTYNQRFPAQFEELLQKLRAQPEATCAETNNPFTKELPDSGTANASPPPEKIPSTAKPSAPAPSRPPSNPSDGSNGKTLLPVEGSYELLQRIGHGQFGEVFKARAPGGGIVALKRIFRPLDDAATQRERKALDLIIQLNHPFLLQTQLYWVAEGRLVIVMELADGSLADWLKEFRAQRLKGIPVLPLLEYFRQAAAALDYLHSQKPAVMHRDIKPANLLRIKGYAKVADFGLLREQGPDLVTATYCGTPAYMPPEMWNSKVHRNSDQYSLAVTYVEMRLGRRCFTATNPRDLAFQHLEGRSDLTGLEPAEQPVLAKALSPDPEKRYPSCQAFVQALLDVFQPAPKPIPVPPRLFTAVLATGLVMALAVIGVLIYGYLRQKADFLPDDWTRARDSKLIRDMKGRRYWNSLTRTKGGQEVALLAIPKTISNDPDTFYIMRDKVWNDLFKAVMETPEAQERLKQLLRESGLQNVRSDGDDYIDLGRWKRGANVRKTPVIGAGTVGLMGSSLGQGPFLAGTALMVAEFSKDLGVDGPYGKLPVMGVTVLEAQVFAERLGGRVPSESQLLKAAGKDEAGSGEGPYKVDPKDPHSFKGIAINLIDTGPRPVGESEQDVSIYGCRDQAGNGSEWTRTLSKGVGEVPVANIGISMPRVRIVGNSIIDERPWRFNDKEKSAAYNETEHYYGFRIVLEERSDPPH
jgi:serine/threonine protein kinase/formylglycine-generating enzyme required for sulfatase activity